MKPAPPVTKIRSRTVLLQSNVSRAAVHKLIEIAFLAFAFFFLIKEGKLAVIENFEEFFPGDLLEAFFGLAEIDAQDAAVRIAFLGRSFDARGPSAAFFYPMLDDSMIGRGLGFGYEQSL